MFLLSDMIFVLTGNGKGKTTSAIGMGVRAVGAGKRVKMIQFLKTGDSSEIKTIDRIDGFDTVSFGREGFILPEDRLNSKARPVSDEDIKMINSGLKEAKEACSEYDMVILDEINVVLDFGLAKIEGLLEQSEADVVLTGRNCPQGIMDMADLVTSFEEVKHYYKDGVDARLSIEY